MKKFNSLILIILVPAFIMAQSVSPQVVSSAGDYFEGTNASLSWTLGEIATETFVAGDVILTQGFQQPIGITITGIDLEVFVFLEGPYLSGQMNTDLYDAGLIPPVQPYNVDPWYYEDNTSYTVPTDAVDWILVEIRDASTAENATGTTMVSRQAAFLTKDGSVIGTDGSPLLKFDINITDGLFLAIWHRNHLGILSADALSESGGLYSYDFSTGSDKVHGGTLGYKLMGVHWGMPGGNTDTDKDIDETDKSNWASDAGQYGYKVTDFNLDTQVSNQDKNDVWVENTSLESQVPD